MAHPFGKPGVTPTETVENPQPVAAPALAPKAIRVLSLNCEGKRHMAARILPFIAQHRPDVLALQEFNQSDLPKLETLGYNWHRFMPMMLENDGEQGIALLARMQPDNDATHEYYLQKLKTIGAPRRITMPDGYHLTDHTSLQYGMLVSSFAGVRVATTHLMVTHQGKAHPVQTEMAKHIIVSLKSAIKHHRNMVLCGDLNAPREGETWGMFAEVFTDNIPAEAVTTLDRTLHLSGMKSTFNDFVVDGVFSHGYVYVGDVKLHFGLSDHAGILFTAIAMT